ncbi:MAG TPA: TIGR04283 family arsenosugar biosynthesis glycosyltransferase [Candidatus Polarisedimenticolia bacterium]|nr:TIGR04283 family arsenosugar biosynthesis glycosyltransferase [Candidatus Polarisedimenticolia bacterium]
MTTDPSQVARTAESRAGSESAPAATVSIIIPTVNEAELVADQIGRCLALTPTPEVIVADAGSQDGTPNLAEAAGARLVACPQRGRALQMNAGAAAAQGSVLLFLHADVMLPQMAFSAMQTALSDTAIVGGAFRRRFDDPSRLLAFGCRLADWRGKVFGLFFGDQSIFVRRETFRRIGGFPEILLFEDLALSRLLGRAGRTCLVRETIIASGRRFRSEGSLRRLARNGCLTCLYVVGVDPRRLAHRYYPQYFSLPQSAEKLGRRS